MDALLVTNVSRLGRDMLKTKNLIRKLNEQGIKIYSLLEGEITAGIHDDTHSATINTLNL